MRVPVQRRIGVIVILDVVIHNGADKIDSRLVRGVGGSQNATLNQRRGESD